MKSIGDICEVNPRLPRGHGIADDLIVSFVPMAAVNEVSGTIQDRQARPYSDVKKGYTHFKNDDVLFAKITPCMENGKAAIASGLAGGLGFGSTEFHVLRAKDQVLPEWLFHFVRQPAFRIEAKRNFTGTAGQQRVPTTFLSSAMIPVPPLPEQRRIVDLLSRAEGIVRLRREAEKKAAELIPALFLDMFGDPATNPKGWLEEEFGDVITYSRYGPRFPNREYAESGAHILRTTDMSEDGFLRWRDSPIMPVSPEEIAKYQLPPRTLLITRTGTIGRVAMFMGASEPCIAGAYLLEFGLKEKITPDYALAFFLSAYGQRHLIQGSRSVAQPNINAPTVMAIKLPIPPMEYQLGFSKTVADIRSIQAQQASATAKAKATFDALLAQAFEAHKPAYDENEFQQMVKRGTAAWSDVPNATEWLEELRDGTL